MCGKYEGDYMEAVLAVIGGLIVFVLSVLAVFLLNQLAGIGLEVKGIFVKTRCAIVYPVIAAIAGALHYYIGKNFHGSVEFILDFIILSAMAGLSFSDTMNRKIPNRFLLGLLLAWIVINCGYCLYSMEDGFSIIIGGLSGALISGAVFLLCYIIVRGQLGAGDVKMAAVLGLYLMGDRVITALIFGIFASAIYALVMVLTKKMTIKDSMPMAPFLFIGSVIVIVLT